MGSQPPNKPMTSIPAIQIPPETLTELQAQYAQELQALWLQGLNASAPLKDRRFAAPAWQENPLAGFNAALYLLNARTLMSLAEKVDTDEKTRARIQFAVEQWVAATSPSNFMALNAEAQKKALDTQGESIKQGIQNMLHDMRQGHVSMTDESLFEVGKNVATTEGAVVFENELFQLIEYKPLTAKVYQRPFLLVPPCINKFYILDLQPTNSLVRYAVSQGHRTFVVSWRNPDESMSQTTWDDYVERGVMQAIEVARQIGNMPQINALGFCVGGTLLTSALAVLAARGQDPVASATLLTTFVDFSEAGVLDVFIDEAFVKFREAQFSEGGLMAGRDMASTFSFLRPNPPTCPVPCTPGICATPIWKTTSSSRARPRCAANRLICAKSICRSTSMVRAKTTSCPLAALMRPPRCCRAPSVLSWVRRGTSLVSSTRPRPTNAAIGCALTAAFPRPSMAGCPKPKSTRAAGGPIGRLG